MPFFSDHPIESNLYVGKALEREIRRRINPANTDEPYDHAFLVSWPALDLVPRGTKLGEQTVIWADYDQVWCVPPSHPLASCQVWPDSGLDNWLKAAQSARVGGSILQLTAPHYGDGADLKKQTVSALIFTNYAPVRDRYGRDCVDFSKSLRSWLRLCSPSLRKLAV